MNRSIDQSWCTAEEAQQILGVQRKTLYTYASRGWIQTQKQGRRKRYRRLDVLALRERADAHAGREARAAGSLWWGQPVLTTQISAHDADGPYYRGTSALDLLDTPIETVAALLWDAPAVAFPDVTAPHCRTLEDLAASVLTVNGPAAQVVAHVWAATALPAHPDLHAAMVLCADHGLNASTFTTRVVASTGASVAASVAAGLLALSGPRHGTASQTIWAEVNAPPRPRATGFSHPFYPFGDPRGEALVARCPPTGRLARRVDAMAPYGKPDLDVGLLSVCLAHGLGPEAAPLLFACGRVLGWVAHIQEQQRDGRLIRPIARAASSG